MHPVEELNQIERLFNVGQPHLRRRELIRIEYHNHSLPIYALSLGSEEPNSPVVAFTGGVHGLERIGSQVIIAFMQTLIERLGWDAGLAASLEHVRLLFIPVVNPVGLLRHTRANGNGVDLMRNAPVEAEGKVPWLVGGHRYSPKLPWYRGAAGAPMETEAAILCSEIETQLFHAPFAISLDCHSGFGFEDRIWFPYAYTPRPIENLAEVFALRELLHKTYPHLNYVFEPQADNYMTHGDLWDHLYLRAVPHGNLFLPLTMEMGSWRWVKKNPRQLFSSLGLFHPIKPHRTKRVLRRHIVFMEFLINAARAYRNWLPEQETRQRLHESALELWYDRNTKTRMGSAARPAA